jgi:hypothetical protein
MRDTRAAHDEPRWDDDPVDDGRDADWGDDEPTEVLPPRRRRRLATPATAVLAAALIGALGFYGGVEVQKHRGAGPSANAAPAGATGAGAVAGAGRGAAGRGGRANATTGSVTSKKGGTLYVKGTDGTTVKVRTTHTSKVNRTASTTAGAIHPGDTVVVQGTTAKSGTVTATQITATSAGALSNGGGPFGGGGLFGGGGRGGGGAPPGGAQPGG